MTNRYNEAVHARELYRRGVVSRAVAIEMMREYIEEYNAKATELARKYDVKPRLFNFAAFCR